jgi:hypothetical protein
MRRWWIAGLLVVTVGTIFVGVRAMERIDQAGSKQNPSGAIHEGFILVQPGLESRCFVKKLGDKDFYWLDYGPDVQAAEIKDKMTKLDEMTLAVWIQVEGKMESGGAFGHLNQYTKRLLIGKIIKCSSNPVEEYKARHK